MGDKSLQGTQPLKLNYLKPEKCFNSSEDFRADEGKEEGGSDS